MITGKDDAVFMTRSFNVTPKTTEQHLIARSDKCVAYVTKKLFSTNNIDTVKACQEFFSFALPSVQLAKRVVKFESKVNTV